MEMNAYLKNLQTTIDNQRQELLAHKVYQQLTTLESKYS